MKYGVGMGRQFIKYLIFVGGGIYKWEISLFVIKLTVVKSEYITKDNNN